MQLRIAYLIAIVFTVYTIYRVCTIESDPYSLGKYDCNSDIPSIQLYFLIQEYADKYDIPHKYAFALAYQETRYQGPLHFKYNPKQISYAGAVGPMQIMPATARGLLKRPVTVTELYDLELNVELSMMLLRRLYDKHGDWKLVFGAYNTGRPMVNQYALNVYNGKYKWITND